MKALTLGLILCLCTQAQTKRSPKPGDELDQSIQSMTDKTQDLRKQVCFDVPLVLHTFFFVSDMFYTSISQYMLVLTGYASSYRSFHSLYSVPALSAYSSHRRHV